MFIIFASVGSDVNNLNELRISQIITCQSEFLKGKLGFISVGGLMGSKRGMTCLMFGCSPSSSVGRALGS